MLRLKGSKAIAAAAVAGSLALMALSVPAAQADGWKGHGNGHGNGWGNGHHRGHNGWGGGSRFVIQNGYYYAPPPPVYYAPPPPVYYAPPPPVYYQPQPVYVAPPLVSLQFRL